MSPRKTRRAAVQATKSLATPKKQSARAKKKPEPKTTPKKKPQKPRNTSKKNNQIETTRNTGPKTDTKISTENLPKIKSEKKSPKNAKDKRRKVISQDRLLNVINQIGGTVGERSEKRIKIETEEEEEEEEISLTQAVQEQQDETNDDSEQRTIYSCKFCNKDFSSAFILLLHVRIHEKVGSIKEPTEEVVPVQSQLDDHYADEDDSDDEPEIKEEVIEEITIPDLDDDDDDDDEPEPEDNQLQITNQPKANEFVGIINKNFVENLRKNLSLAMNRQVN